MNEPNASRSAGESLGAELRKQREIRGISLKEIADATKVSRRYLEALESDDYSMLPAPVFARGFVREFARYIGLDAEEMADRYAEAMKRTDPGSEADGSEGHSQPLPLIRVDRNILTFAVLLVVFCLVVWWVWRNVGTQTDEPVQVAESTTMEPAVAAPLVEVPAEEPPPPEVLEPEKLELRVEVNEDAWVILQIDGKAATNEVLRKGDVRTFTADNEFRFEVVGNAGGLALTLNGRPVAPLGASGRVVRNVVFDWNVLESMKGEAEGNDA